MRWADVRCHGAASLRLIGVAMERRFRVDWCSDGRSCGFKLSPLVDIALDVSIIEKTKLRILMVVNQ